MWRKITILTLTLTLTLALPLVAGAAAPDYANFFCHLLVQRATYEVKVARPPGKG